MVRDSLRAGMMTDTSGVCEGARTRRRRVSSRFNTVLVKAAIQTVRATSASACVTQCTRSRQAPLDAEEIAQLDEEPVVQPAHFAEPECLRLGEAAAVAGEKHRPRPGLIGEEPVDPQIVGPGDSRL